MKVDHGSGSKRVRFDELAQGDVFEVDGVLMLKMEPLLAEWPNPGSLYYPTALILESGALAQIPGGAEVAPRPDARVVFGGEE